MTMQANIVTLPDMYAEDVDKLGRLRAQARILQEQIKAYEQLLKAAAREHNRKEFNGRDYRVTVSCSERAKVDWRTVAERLEPSHQLVSVHTSHQEVCILRVSAHRKEV